MNKLNKEFKEQAIKHYGAMKESGMSIEEIQDWFVTEYGISNIDSIRQAYDTLHKYGNLKVEIDSSALEAIAAAKNDLLTQRKVNIKQRNILNADLNDKAYKEMIIEAVKNYKWKEYEPIDYFETQDPSGKAVYIIADEHFKGNCDVDHLNMMYDKIHQDIMYEGYNNVELWYLGDGVDGLIHTGNLATNDGAIQPTIQYMNILIDRVNQISQVKTVRFVSESNHTQTRPLGTPRNDLAREDLNYLIINTMKYGLRKDIKLFADDILLFRYNDLNIALLHGHQPYAKSKAKMVEYWSSKYGMVPDITIMGHYHTFKVNEYGDNKWLVVAPTAKNFNGDYERVNGYISNNQIMKLEFNSETPRFEIINIRNGRELD